MVASVTEVKRALQATRRATVARALALANACSVKVPRALLGEKANDHPLTAAGTAAATVEQPMAAFHSEAAAHSHQPGGGKKPNMTLTTLYRGEYHPEQASQPGGQVSSGHELDGRNGSHKGAAAKNADSCMTAHQPTTVAPGQITIANQWERRVAAGGRGFTLEWCRKVDAWCRQTCSTFRRRVASEVVRSAQRLSWLHGACACGGEELAALATFGDVPDFLEILGSMGEITILVAEHFDRAGSEAQDTTEPDLQRKIEEKRDLIEGPSRMSTEIECSKMEKVQPTTRENTEGHEETAPGAGGGVLQQRSDHKGFTGPIAVDDSILDTNIANSLNARDDTGGIKSAVGPSQRPRHRKSFQQSEFLPTHREDPEEETESNDEKPEQERGLHLRPSSATTITGSDPDVIERQKGGKSPNRVTANSGEARNSGIERTRRAVAGATLRGSITLNPSSLKALLGMPPLSAFVLRAGSLEALESSPYRTSPPHAFGAQEPASDSYCTTRVRATGISRLLDQPVPTQIETVDSKSESKHRYPDVRLSEKERNGLGDVVELLILPRIRLSSPKSVVGSEPALSVRLMSSKSTSTGSGKAARGNRVACSLSRLSPCLRRFLEAPLFRWVDRDGGRRRLFSCPTVNLGATLANVQSHQGEPGREAITCTVEGTGKSTLCPGPSDNAHKACKSRDSAMPLFSVHDLSKDQQYVPNQWVEAGTPSSNIAGDGNTLVESSEVTDGLSISAVDSRRTASLDEPAANIAAGHPASSVARGSHMPVDSKRREAVLTTLTAAQGQGHGGAGPVRTILVGVARTKDLSTAPTTKHQPAFWLSKEEWARASTRFTLDRPLCHNCWGRNLRRLETNGFLWPPREYRTDMFTGQCCEPMARHVCTPVRDHKRRLDPLQSTDLGV